MMKLHIRTMKLKDLKRADYNPRIFLMPNDPEFEKLKRSIETFGLVEPIVYNERTGTVVGGHQRLSVLEHLGWDEVDVSVVNLAEEEEKVLNVALNKIEGGWDNYKLKDLLEELDTGQFNISLTGFDEDEIENLMTQFHIEDESEVKEDDFDLDKAADEIVEPVSKLGDIWRLGRHRLVVGDSTNPEVLRLLLDGKEADMVFTDPPYNVNYEGSNGKKIQNDHMEDSKFYIFLREAFDAMHEVLTKGGPIYVCHADSEGRNFRNAFSDAGFLMKQCIVWVKNSLVLGRQDYQWKHEPILYGWKEGAAHKWYGGRKETTVMETPVDLAISRYSDHVVLTFTNGTQSTVVKVPSYEILYAGNDEGSTTWRIEKPKKNGDHPTMKPISLCARAIKNSSQPNEIVLDPFGGSGSTLMAAHQVGRCAYIAEIDPIYADVIVKRYRDFIGSDSGVSVERNGEVLSYKKAVQQREIISRSNR